MLKEFNIDGKDVYVEKKNGNLQKFDMTMIFNAVSKSAERVMTSLSDDDKGKLEKNMIYHIKSFNYITYSENNRLIIHVNIIHNMVELSLDEINPAIAKSYRDYRDYKLSFVHILDNVYKKAQTIMYRGDKDNANTDSALVSTKRSLIYNQLNKELYQKFNMRPDELEACVDGYIYIHDMVARRDTFNCCIYDIASVLSGGFEMGNVWYNEPKSISTAFDVIGDIVLSAAAQQYGGFTIPEIDKILEPYAEKSYNLYLNEFAEAWQYDGINEMLDLIGEDFGEKQVEIYRQRAIDYATKKLNHDIEQGFQGWEYKFNTIGSSRGDYPFISISFGLSETNFGRMINTACLKTRMNGQGKEGHKKPVLFPKLTFLYDKELHGEGKPLEDIFINAIECSQKAMYPDYLSLTGEGYIPSMYKKYGKVVSLMGCRASLSPWYEKGGMSPKDENDEPVFVGRFNMGAVTLHLPMILAKAREENKDFYDVLDYYMEMIRRIHKRTYEYLGNMKASTNPLAFCEGGIYGGHLDPNDKIKDLLPPMTISFGITALNELQVLYNGKTIREDGEFALEVMDWINKKIDEYKKEDKILYAVYGTPAETLAGTQAEQFRKKYGIIKGVSDRGYVTNSFHCHVSEEMDPIEKQDKEKRFWDYFNGGKIQYCRYPIDYNKEAMITLVRRAMDLGFYEGINLSLAYCEDCGYEELGMDVCPKCGSSNLTKIERMNGYLGYSRVKGSTRFNDAKMEEFYDRVSM